jgi:hypothetical protein
VRERDPITLGTIRTRFLLARGGAMIAYDAHSLLACVRTTYDLRDPVARQELASHELRRLTRACGAPMLDVHAVRQARHDELERQALVRFLMDEALDATDAGAVEAMRDLRDVAHPGELRLVLDEYARLRTDAEIEYAVAAAGITTRL